MIATVGEVFYAIIEDTRKTTPVLYGKKNTVDSVDSSLFTNAQLAYRAAEFLSGMGLSKYPYIGVSRVVVAEIDVFGKISVMYATNDPIYDTVEKLMKDIESFLPYEDD